MENRKNHIIQALKEVELMEKGELPSKTGREFLNEIRGGKDKLRVLELENGTVFTLYDKYTLMFEDNLFYEVGFGGYEIPPFINPIWNKTGRIYTMEEVNELK